MQPNTTEFEVILIAIKNVCSLTEEQVKTLNDLSRKLNNINNQYKTEIFTNNYLQEIRYFISHCAKFQAETEIIYKYLDKKINIMDEFLYE
jgi:hypothetical protein